VSHLVNDRRVQEGEVMACCTARARTTIRVARLFSEWRSVHEETILAVVGK
jgi:hypothetical protein